MVLTDVMPPVGLDLSEDRGFMIAHAALTPGDLVCIDFTSVDSNSLLFNKTKAVPAKGTGGVGHVDQVFLICLDTIASGGTGQFMLRGNVKAKIATTSIAIGDTLCATDAANTLSESSTSIIASAVKILGRARATNTVANALTEIWFDGYTGLSHGGVPV